MSFRSGANTDLILRNLQVNGKLTVANELDITNLYVSGTTVTHDLQVTGNAVLNTVNANGNIVANSQTVTPTQLGYVSGATSNLQSQINTKAPTANPSFTGTANLPTTQCDGVMYLQNSGSSVDNPIDYKSQYFGAIGANATSGHAEVDFVNMGYNASNTTLSAFDWYLMTSATAKTLLARLYNSGNMFIQGILTASGISTTTLTATGQSQLAGVSCSNLAINGNTTANAQTITPAQLGYVSGATSNLQSQIITKANTASPSFTGTVGVNGGMNVTGNLNVTGRITGQIASNMEVVQYNLTGNGGSATVTMPLQYNTTETTNYIVIPTIYYGYNGSSGTYNAMNSSLNLANAIVISNRTSSSFVWQTTKNGTGDNINVWISFLVIYNCQGTNYPVSY
jgi:cytoskeletal protein CcmA (bactofilin family)